MRRTSVKIALTLLAVAGCAELTSRDATEEPSLIASGWSRDAVYETALPVFLIQDPLDKTHFIARSNADDLHPRMVHGCFRFHLPRNLAEYQSDASRWPDIVGVLPSGTKIRFLQAYNRGWESRRTLDWNLYALELRGETIAAPPLQVNLWCVSRPNKSGTLWLRDPEWLR